MKRQSCIAARLPAGRQGFTLLELLVTATLIAVLTVIGIVSYNSVNKRSRDVKRKSDLEQIRSALEMYRTDNGYYPPSGAGAWANASTLDTGDTTGLVSIYIPAVPADPQPSAKSYFYVATRQDIATSRYYGYCLCGNLETLSASSTTCVSSEIPGGSLPAQCNYGLKNP
jgi:general secretion pathway protein G